MTGKKDHRQERTGTPHAPAPCPKRVVLQFAGKRKKKRKRESPRPGAKGKRGAESVVLSSPPQEARRLSSPDRGKREGGKGKVDLSLWGGALSSHRVFAFRRGGGRGKETGKDPPEKGGRRRGGREKADHGSFSRL